MRSLTSQVPISHRSREHTPRAGDARSIDGFRYGPGYTGGVVTAIDLSSINIAATRLQAYDAQADYTLETDRAGALHFYAVATREPLLERRTVPTASFVDFVGFDSGVLEWRGNVGLDWSRGSWMLGWNAQYYDSYLVYAPGSTAATIATAILNQGSATIPSQTYHDVFARYRFGGSSTLTHGVLANTEILVGIQNVFNTSPPIVVSGNYSTYGDPRLRRYSITLRHNF